MSFLAALVNGVAADSLPLADRALHYGDGVFETMHAVGGRIPLLARHLARLELGCARLGIAPQDPRVLLRELTGLAESTDAGVVKLIVSRGTGGRGYRPGEGESTRIALAYARDAHSPDKFRDGVTVGWCALRLARSDALAGIKHLNRIEQVLASAEREQAGWYEGLLCDQAGRVVSAISANVFVRFGATLATPDVSRAGVAGVARGWLLDEPPAGLDVAIRDMLPREIHEADEVFLTSALRGVVPVVALGERRWAVGAAARAARERFEAIGIGAEPAP